MSTGDGAKKSKLKNKPKIKKTKLRQTSYEMDCATQRVAPRIAYFLLDPQPPDKSPKMEREKRTKTKSIRSCQERAEEGNGSTDHKRAGMRNKIRQEEYIAGELDFVGRMDILVRSLRASAKGTRSPLRQGLLGPKRNIIYPSTLRSMRVKKATEISTSKRESAMTI